MKIAQAELQMASSHASFKRHEIRESLRAWIGPERPDFSSPAPANRPEVSLSERGRAMAASAEPLSEIRQTQESEQIEEPQTRLLRLMIEALTGRPVRIFDARELSASSANASDAIGSTADATRQSAGFGIEYERHESYAENETSTFSASGLIKTADGREIRFELNVAMQRSYYEENSTRLRLGDAARKIDPLVLNFSGDAASLDNQRFSFDLNSDGQSEQIARLATGSAYLVLDRNADGRVNNGQELFGPQTGDGFAELATLDDDRNGWIDENDSAFNQLRLWSPDTQGGGALRTLAENGVGAISLARLATPFDLKNNNNELLGQIRSSGIFLHESGRAGTIQQIDLTV